MTSERVPTGDPRRTSEVVRDVVSETQTLLRHEVELARIELTAAITAKVQAGAALAVAGVLGLFALGFGAAAGASALSNVVEPWLAQLIVAAIFLVIAGLAALFARGRSTVPMAPEQTKQSLKEDARWARTQLER